MNIVVAACAHLVNDPTCRLHPNNCVALEPISESTAASIWLHGSTSTPIADLLLRCHRSPAPRHLQTNISKLANNFEFSNAIVEALLCNVHASLAVHCVVASMGHTATVRALAHALTNRELHDLACLVAHRGRGHTIIRRAVGVGILRPSTVVQVAHGALLGCRSKPEAVATRSHISPHPFRGDTVCKLAVAAHRPLRPAIAVDALGGNTGLLGPVSRKTGPANVAGLGTALGLAIMPISVRDTAGVVVVCTTCRSVRSPVAGRPAKRRRSAIVVDVENNVGLCGQCMTPTLAIFKQSCNVVVADGAAIVSCDRCSRSFVGIGNRCLSCMQGPNPAERCFARCRTKAITVPFVARTCVGLHIFYACTAHVHCIPNSIENIVDIGARYKITL